MINIYLIIYFIYIFSVGLIYLYKSQTKVGQYKPLLLFIITIFTSIADIISCLFYENNNKYIRMVNFIISHVLTSLILGLSIYRFISFYINDIRIKNTIKSIDNNLIENKNKMLFTSIFCLFVLALVYSTFIFIKYKEVIININNWQYYPIYIISISFFIIIMPTIIYLLKGIYKNIYECYLTLSMGFLGCFISIIFNLLNINIKSRYILLISNSIIINILYFKPLYHFYKFKKTFNKTKIIKEMNNINDITEIYYKELRFLKEYQILKNIISEKKDNRKTLYLEFYNKNVLELKTEYKIDGIIENIMNDITSYDIFDKLKEDILNKVYCKLYRSLLNE